MSEWTDAELIEACRARGWVVVLPPHPDAVTDPAQSIPADDEQPVREGAD